MKLKAVKDGNWALIIIGTLVFIAGLTLTVISIALASTFGWWSILLFSSGASSMYFSAIAIKHNEPAWLLLDLIIPG